MNTNNIPANAVGLCAGRHPLPVQEYIYGEVLDVLDFEALRDIADRFVQEHCNVRTTFGVGIAQTDYTDVEMLCGDELHVLVTGLTQCTAAVLWACACYGVTLTLWHYNRETGAYVPQQFKFGF